MKRLSGKRAIITGGTRGIGRAIATLFIEQGASVTIFGTNEERGAEVVAELNGYIQGKSKGVACCNQRGDSEGGDEDSVALLRETDCNEIQKIEFLKVDVSRHAECAVAIKKVLENNKSIDILVNCAGITRDRLMIRITEDDWDSVIDTNLKSVYNTVHPLLRSMMKKRYGKIINISSIIGLVGNPGQVNYAASKLGMIGLTRSLAKEVAGRGITVNCIAPGYIGTDMTNGMTDEAKSAVLANIPMGKIGDPKEIANAALFLASDESNYITGQVLTVDGGMTA